MMAMKILEQNDPIAEMERLLVEWGKVRKSSVEKMLGVKSQPWVIKKGGVTPMITDDEARVLDSCMSALFNQNKDSWLSIKLYYAKPGHWTHERVALTMHRRKADVGDMLESGVYFLAQIYPKRRKEIFDNLGTRI